MTMRACVALFLFLAACGGLIALAVYRVAEAAVTW